MITAQRAGAIVFCALIVSTLMSAAEARDLPRVRASLPARTGCESFGTGFQKLDGSDTCIRISGSVEAEAIVRTGSGVGTSFFPGTGKR